MNFGNPLPVLLHVDTLAPAAPGSILIERAV